MRLLTCQAAILCALRLDPAHDGERQRAVQESAVLYKNNPYQVMMNF